MPKAYDTWNVLPHDPIEQLAANLWRVQGDLPSMPLKRVLTIARRADGDLVLHNPIALQDAAMAQLESHGRVRYLVVPNGYHRLDSKAFKARYPDALVFCPSGARLKVAQVVPVDGTYADFPADEAVRLRELEGVDAQEGVMEVRSADEVSLVVNDVIFNMPHLGGLKGVILRYLTQSTGGPRITRIARLFIIKDAAALRADLLRLSETPGLRRVIVSHHQTITADPAGTLRALAQTLG